MTEEQDKGSIKDDLYALVGKGVEKVRSNKKPWYRGLYMVVFWFLFNLAEMVLLTTAVFQFVNVLVVGRPNKIVKAFSRGLTRYIYDVMLYVTYGTERRPFPFSDWPEEDERSAKKPDARS